MTRGCSAQLRPSQLTCRSCSGLLQNPQYQCVLDLATSLPFPDCCAHTKQCRDIGPRPQ